MRLSEFAKEYIKWSKSAHKTSTTLAGDLALRKFTNYLGEDLELQKIQVRHADGFVRSCKNSGLQPASTNNHRQHLHACFAKAIAWDFITDNPFSKVPRLPTQDKSSKYIVPSELPKFLFKIQDVDVRLLITGLLVTGLKRNELLMLKWEDLDMSNYTYRVKNNKGYYDNYNINGAFYVVLSLLKSRNITQLSMLGKKKSDRLLYPRWRNPDTVTHLVKQQLIKSGYKHLNLNSFRYTFKELYPQKGGALQLTSFDSSLFNGLTIDHIKLHSSNQEKIFTDADIDLSSEKRSEKRFVFCPNAFSLPSEEMDDRLVSVMMPFKRSFDKVYATIKESVEYSGLKCQRADDIWQNSVVIQDIFNLICKSFIVVCDFSSKNANVFYETGIAHTLGKHVIPITQSPNDTPFDLFHHRYILYLNNNEGRTALRDKLSNRIDFLNKNR